MSPDWKQLVRAQLAPLRLAPERELEIVEELALHLEAAYETALARGLAEEAARAQALAQITDWRLLESELARVEAPRRRQPAELWIEQKGGLRMEALWQDLRYGWRALRKQPGLTAVAVLTLALGIGANTAVFSVVNALMLKILPVNEPRQLVFFSLTGARGNSENFPYPFYEQFRDRSQTCAGVIASGGANPLRMRVSEARTGATAESVLGEKVSGNFFSVLGVHAAAGRLLSAEDDKRGSPQAVAVISYSLWQRRFALDSAVVGRQITLDDVPFTIVGVAPPGFFGFVVGRAPDLWWPLEMLPQVEPGNRDLQNTGSWWLRLMARRKAGVSLTQARAEMDTLFQPLLADIAATRGANWTPTQRRNFLERRIELQDGSTGWTWLRKRFKEPLQILTAVVALVLLVACANLANLLLARGATRQREIAVRLAIGAGRLRLIRQLLVESLLLALVGGVLGLLFAYGGARVLLAYLPQQAAGNFNVGPDAHVLGFTLAVSLLTGVLFGLTPAWRATRFDLIAALKEQAGSVTAGRSRLALNKLLVVTQVALTLFLLIGAGLFVRTLQNLKSLDAGFERENVLLFALEPGRNYQRAQRIQLYQQLVERLEALPGVRAASLSSWSLLAGGGYEQGIAVEGYTPQPDENMFCHGLHVGPKFFATMGIPLLAGRDFGAQDERPIQATQAGQSQAITVPRVAVINQTMAQYFFPNQNPLGRRFYFGREAKGQPYEIIGVVKDAKYETLREKTRRTFYLPYFQGSNVEGMTFELRTLGPPANFAAAVQSLVRELDPNLPVLDLRTMNEVVDASLAQERLLAQLAGFFGLLALLLACLGLYGVMSYSVARRSHELGIRMALGAQSGDVLRLVLAQGLRLVLLGVVIGLLAAVALTRWLESLLYGVRPTDPVTFVALALVLIVVALVACWIPARRATRVDPLVALHCE
jgi:putative ABC transport system permease protein